MALIYIYYMSENESKVKAALAKLTPEEQTVIENDIVSRVELMVMMFCQELELESKKHPDEDDGLSPYMNLTLAVGKWLGWYPYAEKRIPSWEELNMSAEEHLKRMEDNMKAEGWIIEKSADGKRASYRFKDDDKNVTNEISNEQA